MTVNHGTKSITYFGEVDIQEEEYFEGSVTLGNKITELTLDFCNYSGKPIKWSEELEGYLAELAKYKTEIDKTILNDYENGGITDEYVRFYLDEWDDIDELLLDTNLAKTKEERFLSLLIQRVEYIHFYPGDKTYAVWDYMIDSDNSDQILVVHTDRQGKILCVTWES